MLDSTPLSVIGEMVDALPISVALLDSSGRILHVNDAWRDFARENGVEGGGDWEGRNYLAEIGGEESDSATDARRGLERILAGDLESYKQTYPCHSPQEKRWFRMHVVGFTNDGHQYATVAHLNVTEERRSTLRTVLFDSLFEDDLGCSILIEDSGEVVAGNEQLFEFIDAQPEDIVGKPYRELFDRFPETSEGEDVLASLVGEILGSERDHVDAEAVFSLEEGPLRTEVRVDRVDIDRYTNGVIVSIRDVTKLKRREDRLRMFERAVEGSTNMLCAIAPDGSYLFANDAYREFHGIESGAVSELRIEDVLSGSTLETVQDHIRQTLAGDRNQYTQERMGPDGQPHPLRARYYPLRDASGAIEGAVVAMEDLTERRQRERHLFVLDRVLRHNMHNDMTIIKGFAELIQEEGAGQVSEYGRRIAETAAGLLGTVDKQREIIALLSKPPRLETFDAVDVVDRAIADLEVDYPDAVVTVDAPESAQMRAISKVDRGVRELIENAIVHAEGNCQVTVRVRVEADWVTIAVADDGPGIPDEERRALLEGSEVDPLNHGSGLGLWLVDWIVSRSEGTLQLGPNERSGSVVTMQLPRP